MLYDRPVDPWVASFIGQMNLFPGSLDAVGDPGVVRLERGSLVGGLMPDEQLGVGDRALIAVRPERVWLRAASDPELLVQTHARSRIALRWPPGADRVPG